MESLTQFDKVAVENFRTYLRIPSVHPNVNYDECVKFLKKQAKELNLVVNIYYCFPKKPIVVLSWIGEESNLPSVLLNSHMDVVPVEEEQWTYKPFNATIDEEGNIYARGAQDVKCLGIQYLEAIRRLQIDGFTPRHTVHVSFVPDEEIGSDEGMRAFVKTDDFKKLDIGFALDEACGNPNGSDYIVFNAEKYGMKFTVHCPGPSGHGSSIQISNTAGEKVQRILNRVYEFREQQKNKVKTFFELGTITTINLTMMKGGLQNNVLPTNLELVFDARVSPTVSEDEWESILNGWCKEAGDDVWIEYQIKDRCIAPTILDADNPYWMAFRQTLDNMDAKYNVLTLPACTDARFLREARVPTIGFSPNNNTPIKAHCSNEFLNVKTFLTGINVYTKIIQALCNV